MSPALSHLVVWGAVSLTLAFCFWLGRRMEERDHQLRCDDAGCVCGFRRGAGAA